MNRWQDLCGLAAGLCLAGQVSVAETVEFIAHIDGAQAANCAGTGSPGTGTGTLTLDTVTGMVSYDITFSGLVAPESISHVHGAAAMCTGAGVVYGLPLGSPKIGMATLTAPQVSDMLAQLHYVNIHSTMHPAGEIRGQIVPLACLADLTGPNPGDPPDGTVNVFDLLALLGNFGTAGPLGDITGSSPGDPPDGTVNVFDLLALLARFGQTCPSP